MTIGFQPPLDDFRMKAAMVLFEIDADSPGFGIGDRQAGWRRDGDIYVHNITLDQVAGRGSRLIFSFNAL
jgi:hypothetical protein